MAPGAGAVQCAASRCAGAGTPPHRPGPCQAVVELETCVWCKDSPTGYGSLGLGSPSTAEAHIASPGPERHMVQNNV